MKLFMILLGCRPKGRFTEQHDIFFGIGEQIKDLVPAIVNYWPEANGNIHIDAWRQVNYVDGYEVSVHERGAGNSSGKTEIKLFFVNLGGYKENEFDEFHYKTVVAAPDMKTAQRMAMDSAFFKHTSLPKTELHFKASAHIDDKYGIDVDDIFAVKDILSATDKRTYFIQLDKTGSTLKDGIHLGYFKLADFDDA